MYLFLYTVFLPSLRGCVEGVWSMQQWINPNTDHKARLEREMLNIFISYSVCLIYTHTIFLFSNCIMLIKEINYCHILLTASLRRYRKDSILISLIYTILEFFYIEKNEDGWTSMFAFVLFIQMMILFAKSLKVFNYFMVVLSFIIC